MGSMCKISSQSTTKLNANSSFSEITSSMLDFDILSLVTMLTDQQNITPPLPLSFSNTLDELKASFTSPLPLCSLNFVQSVHTIPAESCPRCCNISSPSYNSTFTFPRCLKIPIIPHIRAGILQKRQNTCLQLPKPMHQQSFNIPSMAMHSIYTFYILNTFVPIHTSPSYTLHQINNMCAIFLPSKFSFPNIP